MDVTQPTSSPNMAYQVVEVTAEDIITATGRASTGKCGFAILDTNYNLLVKGSVIYTDKTIEVTQDGYVILNINKLGDYSAKKGINKITEIQGKLSDFDNIENEVESISQRITAVEGNESDTRALVEVLDSNIHELVPKDFSSGYTLHSYINIPTTAAIGDVVELTPQDSAAMGYQIIDCSKDDYFEIAGRAVSGSCGFVYLDENNQILHKSSTIYDMTFVCPDDGKLVLNINTHGTYFAYRGHDKLANMNAEIGLNELNFKPNFIAGLWTVNGSENSATSYSRTEESLFFEQGTTFKIYATTGGSSSALITEWSENGVFIQTLVYDSNSDIQTTYTLDHDAYLRFCYKNTTGFSATYTKPSISKALHTGAEAREYAESLMYQWERILNSVCCIGDSLTSGAYFVNGRDGSAIEQNYSYFFSKQTGVTVQNEGVGGSSPSSRWGYFSSFDFTPYNAFFIWWGTNDGLTDTLLDDGVIDSDGNLIANYSSYADTNTGDYCKVIGRIISQVPHAKIFLATIFTTSGSGGAVATNQVIAKIAELYPDNVMGVVDCNDGTLYTLARKRLTPPWVHIDNITHFSMIGNYYLAVHWIKAIRAIIAANPAKFEDIMEDILV